MAPQGEKTNRDSATKADMAAKPQTQERHPDDVEQDLNPERLAGQNIGPEAARAEKEAPTAHQTKDVREALQDEFTNDELKKIHILEEGQRLRQGARYLDVNARDREAFTATGDQSVNSGQRIVPKAQTPYSLWNRLRGVEGTERTLEQEGERGA